MNKLFEVFGHTIAKINNKTVPAPGLSKRAPLLDQAAAVLPQSGRGSRPPAAEAAAAAQALSSAPCGATVSPSRGVAGAVPPPTNT